MSASPRPRAARSIVRTDLASVPMELVMWLWHLRMPLGEMTLFYGREGFGKTALLIRLIAALTTGRLPGDFEGEPMPVALASVEDSLRHTLKPRLVAAGADLNLVHLIAVKEDDRDSRLILPRDTEMLDEFVMDTGSRALFLDPASALFENGADAYKEQTVRETVTPLILRAHKHKYAVGGSLHTNRAAGTDGRMRAGGSVAWRFVARSIFTFGLDPDDPDGAKGPNRMLAHNKTNLGALQPSVRVKVVMQPVSIEETVKDIMTVELGEETAHTEADVLRAEAGVAPKDGAPKLHAAREFLLRGLADGPVAGKELIDAANAEGITNDTLHRAKKELQVTHHKDGKGYVWTLPADTPHI